MVGVYRCECGHSWKAGSEDSRQCPACGSTAIADNSFAQDQTQVHWVGDSDPSFSSLADPGKKAPDPFAMTRECSAQEQEEFIAPPTLEFKSSIVPGYEIFEEIGRGGMGVVYKAQQASLNRPVALKMILAGSHAGPVERERFRREAQAVASLQHPNIVQIFEIGESNGHAYLALEYVEGGSLAHHLKGDPWPAREAAALVELLARAVHYAHSQGVVHRDLKPGNILLSQTFETRESKIESGQKDISNVGVRTSYLAPKITNFGLAKRIDETLAPEGATKTGAVMGTPSYIAPEQASGKTREIGPGVDVYSLGAILYELLTGRPPFRGETPLDTVLQVINEDPVAPKSLQPNIPWDLQTICLKCLMKTPGKRYPTAQALADDLRRYLNGEPIQAKPASSWDRTRKWARRHPALAVLGLTSIVATVALVTILSMAYAHVSEAKYQKELEADAAKRAHEQEEIERRRAQHLAAENETARVAAVAQAEQLKRESERNRRGAYALQIAQIAAMCERDPRRAQMLLEDPSRCPADLRDFAWAYLHRLCLRDDRIYSEHGKGDALEAVAVSRGGTFVATAGARGEVRVWDPRTGRTYAILSNPAGAIHGLAFSPDGSVLAAACADGAVRVWEFPADMLDLARRTMNSIVFLRDVVRPFTLPPALTLLSPKQSPVTCVAFHPSARQLAAGCEDGDIELWLLDGWRPNVFDLAAVGGPSATAMAITRGGPSPRAKRAPGVKVGNDQAIRCLAFSQSGQMLAFGCDDKRVRVLVAAPGQSGVLTIRNGSYQLRLADRHDAAVTAVTFTPDDRTLVAVNNGDTPIIRLIDTGTWKDERRLIGHSLAIHSLAVSPDGQMLASGGADGTVRLWDLEEGKERATLRGHERAVRGVAFGANRRTVVSASDDGTARIWLTGMRPNESADLTPYRDGSIRAAALDASGNVLVFADGANRVGVKLVDLPIGRHPEPGAVGLFPLPLEVPLFLHRVVAAAPNGRAVFAANDLTILMWRILQLRPKGRDPGAVGAIPMVHAVFIPTPRQVHAMAVDPNDKHLATLDEDGLRLWTIQDFPHFPSSTDLKANVIPELLFPAQNARALAFHPHGDRIAIAVGNRVKVVDLTGKVLADVEMRPDGVVRGAIAFDSDGTQLAVGDEGGLVRVWRVGLDGSLNHQADLIGHTGAVLCLDFTPGGRTLATGGTDRTVVLWDPQTGQERLVLTGHASSLVRLQFVADGHILWSIGADGSVKRWRAEPRSNAREGRPLLMPPRKK